MSFGNNFFNAFGGLSGKETRAWEMAQLGLIEGRCNEYAGAQSELAAERAEATSVLEEMRAAVDEERLDEVLRELGYPL